MQISIITLFPELFISVFASSIIKRAQESKKININIVDLRSFGLGVHKTVDDRPYGGGAGMILRVDVLEKAILDTKRGIKGEWVILLDPKGIPYHQKEAEKLSKLTHLILVCGHYEGFDERIRTIIDEEISIGDYVLTGGEIPAMVVVDSVARLIPGVLKKESATANESFTGDKRILEYPHYTRPALYKKKGIPKELLSGNPKIINEFRLNESLKLTKKRRPDILKEK